MERVLVNQQREESYGRVVEWTTRKGEVIKEVERLLRVEREREKEMGDGIGKKVEAILERWESRTREVVREEVAKVLADRCRRTEGRTDPGPVREEEREEIGTC